MADSSDVTAGVNATATQYNNVRKDLVLSLAVQGTDTPTGAGPDTLTVDWSDKTKGKIRNITVDANTTISNSNVTVGQAMIYRITFTAGTEAITWFTTIKWDFATAPTSPGTAGRVLVVGFLCTSASNYDGYILGNALG